jgi:hypothetical protein
MTNQNNTKKIMTIFSLVALLMLSAVPLGTAVADKDDNKKGKINFKGLDESATCIDDKSPSTAEPWTLPKGWSQKIVAVEDPLGIAIEDLPDMNQQNPVEIPMPDKLKDAGVEDIFAKSGRLLYTTHEVGNAAGVPNLGTASSVSVTDLETGISVKLAEEDHWDRFDGLLWTSSNQLLAAEECITCAVSDPDVTDDKSGFVYEINPVTGDSVVRPALGSLAHEGIGEDKNGNIYIIDEYAFGSIYKFVPDTKGDLRSGTLYALRLLSGDNNPLNPRTGAAEWIPLDDVQVQKDARKAALEVGATQYNRPEDVEILDNVLYVALTDNSRTLTSDSKPNGVLFHTTGEKTPDDRKVIGIDLKDSNMPIVFDFVVRGVNAPDENAGINPGFAKPDNLAQQGGDIWIVEDNGPSDIWKATPGKLGELAKNVELFASNEDCSSEGTGLLWGIGDYNDMLFVNVQHAGPTDASGNEVGADLKMLIFKDSSKNFKSGDN